MERGRQITLLDGGETLPSDIQGALESMKWEAPAEWSTDHIDLVTRNDTVKGAGIPRKLAFGSDYVYGNSRTYAPTAGQAGDVSFTFAKGGFSMVWGAAVLPATDHDTADWPVGRRELSGHYQKVLRELPLSADDDAIATEFPLYRDDHAPVPLIEQSRKLIDRFTRNRDALLRASILAGRARVCVQSEQSENSPGCDGCGLCLTGCPRNAIYNTLPDLEALIAAGRIRYRPNSVVTELTENPHSVTARILDPERNETREMKFRHIFVAAGAVNTARLMMASLQLRNTRLKILESQKFLLPFFCASENPVALDGTGFSLPNGLVLLGPDENSENWCQLQLSPINSLALKKLPFSVAGLPRPLKTVLGALLGRLVFGWGSIHSDHSSTINLELKPAETGRQPVLKIEPETNADFRPAVGQVTKRLWRSRKLLGLTPIKPLMQYGAPGSGNHYGGVFPMRKAPERPWETDVLGRPGGLQRVHIVDASVLPSIPGTTLALPTMANASRIATEAPLD